jgi:CRISPR-associated endoribonuclease Cas6
LHDKKGFKFFSFSNIFSDRSNPDRLFNLIIASPSDKFVNEKSYQLEKIIENELPVEIGTLSELKNFRLIHNSDIQLPLTIMTESPILLRIPLSKFIDESQNSAPHKYVYWRSSHPISLVINSLESNLKKKYADFSGRSVDGGIFESYEFKKQVSTKIFARKDMSLGSYTWHLLSASWTRT